MLRINSVFYLLGELNNNDIIFIDKNGINYTYKVYKQLVVDANQIQYLKYTETDKEVLILQTCWPIGTNWKRLLVFAQRV
jgi:LPXTG-site transpeptidase (sortase) family protein